MEKIKVLLGLAYGFIATALVGALGIMIFQAFGAFHGVVSEPNIFLSEFFWMIFCFFALALAIVFLRANYKKVGAAFLVVVVGISLYYFYQHVMTANFTEFLFFYRLVIQTGAGNYLTLSSSSAFMLITASLVLTHFFPEDRLRFTVAIFMVLIIVSFGCISIMGYALWHPILAIPSNEAFCLLVSGIGFLLLGCSLALFMMCDCLQKGIFEIIEWLSFLTFVVGFVFFGLLSEFLLLQDKSRVMQNFKEHSESVASEIEGGLNRHVQELQEIKDQMEKGAVNSRKEWSEHVVEYFNEIPSLKYVAWVGEKEASSYITQKEKIAVDHEKLKAKIKGTGKKEVLFDVESPPHAIVLLPVYQASKFTGFVVGVINMDEYVRGVSNYSLKQGYNISLSSEEKEKYLFKQKENLLKNKWGFNVNISVAQKTWNVRVWPNQAILDDALSRIPHVIFGVGALMTLLIAIVFYLWQKSLGREKILESTMEERKSISDKMKLLLESTIEGIFGINNRDEITFINSAALRMLGYSKNEALGANYKELFLISKEENQVVLKRKDGTSFVASFLIAVMRQNNKEIGFVITFNDITDRIRQEERLRSYSEELRRSNKELDEFAYIASHDLKEPLRGINNYCSFLIEDYKDVLDEEALYRLNTLQKLSHRMSDLINNLLIYSRVGRGELVLEKLDLVVIAKEKTDMLRAAFPEQNIQLNILEPKMEVYCDKEKIEEVMQNLISNAIKYNKNKVKKIELGVDRRQPSGERKIKKGYQVFYVRDNGIGIDPEYFNDIFKIFKRLHARDEFGGGIGAGLTIVKKVIERHSGEVWVVSSPNEGSIFYFTLPIEWVKLEEKGS